MPFSISPNPITLLVLLLATELSLQWCQKSSIPVLSTVNYVDYSPDGSLIAVAATNNLFIYDSMSSIATHTYN